MLDLSSISKRAEQLRILTLDVTIRGEDAGHAAFDDECRRNVYSASKSFTSIAVGMAQDEGLLSVDERVRDAFSEVEGAGRVPESLTVRHLLTMSMGQESPLLMGSDRPKIRESDWAKEVFSHPFVYEPGTRFLYTNAGPYLAGLLVQKRAGVDLVDFLMPRLFEPLGIPRPTWETDPMKRTFGAGGLMLTGRELHLFGRLMLQEGSWQGRQLVSTAYVKEALSCHILTGRGSEGYGYLFWLGENGSMRADGKYGQISMIFPAFQAVVTVTAESRHPQEILDAIDRELVPQFS